MGDGNSDAGGDGTDTHGDGGGDHGSDDQTTTVARREWMQDGDNGNDGDGDGDYDDGAAAAPSGVCCRGGRWAHRSHNGRIASATAGNEHAEGPSKSEGP